jgi:hypothetical protein
MSDLSDLQGVPPSSLRWNANADAGELLVVITNEAFEREPQPIPLNTASATFVMDMATRERGYGLIAAGIYRMVLTPVGSPPPALPEPITQGANVLPFKPTLGVFVWNPIFDELRLETNASYFRQAVATVWERYRTFKEASQGLQPIIRFTGKRDVPNQTYKQTFQAPLIDIVGWMEREKIAPFKQRPPTVIPPAALDVQIPHQPTGAKGSLDDLQARTPDKLSGGPSNTGDIIEDALPW